jgi:hypothetical protein
MNAELQMRNTELEHKNKNITGTVDETLRFQSS